MNDDQLENAAMTYILDGFAKLFDLEGSRAHLEAFLAGEAVFVVSRAEVQVRIPPPDVTIDLGGLN